MYYGTYKISDYINNTNLLPLGFAPSIQTKGVDQSHFAQIAYMTMAIHPEYEVRAPNLLVNG